MASSSYSTLTQSIQDAVLKLCAQKITFNKSLEIDGIICVSPGDDYQEIVIKMHRTIIKPTDGLTKTQSSEMLNWSAKGCNESETFGYYSGNQRRPNLSHPCPTPLTRSLRPDSSPKPTSASQFTNELTDSPLPVATQETPGGLNIKADDPTSPQRWNKVPVTEASRSPVAIKRHLLEFDNITNKSPEHSLSKQIKLDSTPDEKTGTVNVKQEQITLELEEAEEIEGYHGDSTAETTWMGDMNISHNSTDNQADQSAEYDEYTPDPSFYQDQINSLLPSSMNIKGQTTSQSTMDTKGQTTSQSIMNTKIDQKHSTVQSKLVPANDTMIAMPIGASNHILPSVTLPMGASEMVNTRDPLSRKSKASEVKYKCQLCHRVLCGSTAFKRHYQIHTGEKPFNCSFCDKSFRLKHHMKHHMEQVHRQLEGIPNGDPIVSPHVKLEQLNDS